MSWRNKGKFRKVSGGSKINKKRVYVCEKCQQWHDKKPDFMCGDDCNSTTFLNFDSKAEAVRWGELLLLEKMGRITKLNRQKIIPLYAHREGIGQVKVGGYKADFDYYNENGQYVVEDVKGNLITDLAEWKLRHFEAQYGFNVTLIKR